MTSKEILTKKQRVLASIGILLVGGISIAATVADRLDITVVVLCIPIVGYIIYRILVKVISLIRRLRNVFSK